jgi:hypothetical protein
MTTKHHTLIALGLAIAASCNAPTESPDVALGTASGTAAVTSNDIKDVPAVNPAYPDSIGYVYQGSLATILWLQNQPRAARLEDLERRMGEVVRRGMSGEILSAAMQRVDRPPNAVPALPQMARTAVQSVKLMAQYTFVTSDYANALGNALNAYNSDPARKQAIVDKVAQVDTALRALATANPPGPLPAPPPPANQRMMRPGRHFAESIKSHERAHLVRSAHDLERAIAARNTAAYAVAFGDLFHLQSDIHLSKDAHESLAVRHLENFLRGQPLDTVIARYVTLSDPDRPYSMDQLSVVNRINLMSNLPDVTRQPLVAALLLIDEDHKHAENDPTLSPAVIWSHVGDLTWLVSRYVQRRADGTTDAEVRALLDSIVASL